MTDEELVREIQAQRELMIAVATGGPQIKSVDAEYCDRRERISKALRQRQIDDPNPYSDLWRWYAYWGSKLPTYAARRTHIAKLYDGLIDSVLAADVHTTSGDSLFDDSGETVFGFLPLTIRLATVGGVATPLVLRGTPLPAKRADRFSTAEDNQESVEIEIYMGERPLVAGNQKLGTLRLGGIPPARRGAPSIRIEFDVDRNCKVTAKASVDGAKAPVEQEFKSSHQLTSAYVASVLTEAEANQDADETAIRDIEARNRAKKLIESAEKELSRSSNAAMSEAVAKLGLALESGEESAIRDASDSLDRLVSTGANSFNDMFGSLFGTTPATQRERTTRTKTSIGKDQELVSPRHVPTVGKVFGGGDFTLDTRLCFVLMPFEPELKPLYEDSLRPAIEQAGLRCERADEIVGVSAITWDIWERVNRARLLVADLTGRNANVFYEVGLAHAISKDVVLITQSMDDVPFDLKALRCICYDFTPRGVRDLEKTLTTTIQAVLGA